MQQTSLSDCTLQLEGERLQGLFYKGLMCLQMVAQTLPANAKAIHGKGAAAASQLGTAVGQQVFTLAGWPEV